VSTRRSASPPCGELGDGYGLVTGFADDADLEFDDDA
jgi:hypothetical protein